jgi:hypothetical protein
MTSKVYTLYLSTLTPYGQTAPTDKTNLANVKWNINWDSLFDDAPDCDCNVRFLLVGKSGTYVYNNTLCSLRASFSSIYQNIYNGVNIGLVNPVNNPTSTDHRLFGDTTSSVGVQIQKPTGNQEFRLQMIGLDEAQITNAQDYQVWIYFEFENICN